MLQGGSESGSCETMLEEEGSEKDVAGVGQTVAAVRAFSSSSSPEAEL